MAGKKNLFMAGTFSQVTGNW